MEQGTDAWLDWRKKGIGSSDAPIIMRVSPWKTPFELWQEKTNRVQKEQTSNFAQERGNAIEPIARARYELESDIEMGAALCQHHDHPWMRASMDGWNPVARRGLEIKFVGVEDFTGAQNGIVPVKYIPQLMHQFMVTAAEQIDFYAYSVPKGAELHNGQTALVKVFPDLAYIAKLFEEELRFFQHIKDDVAPPFTKGDFKSVRFAGAKAMEEKYRELLSMPVLEKEEHAMVLAIETMFLEQAGDAERARIGSIRIHNKQFSIAEDDDASS